LPVGPLFHLRHPAVQLMNGRYTTRQYDTRACVTRSQSPDWWCVQGTIPAVSTVQPWHLGLGYRRKRYRRSFQSSVAVSNGQPAQPLQLTRHRERYCDKWTTVLCNRLHRQLADVCMYARPPTGQRTLFSFAELHYVTDAILLPTDNAFRL